MQVDYDGGLFGSSHTWRRIGVIIGIALGVAAVVALLVVVAVILVRRSKQQGRITPHDAKPPPYGPQPYGQQPQPYQQQYPYAPSPGVPASAYGGSSGGGAPPPGYGSPAYGGSSGGGTPPGYGSPAYGVPVRGGGGVSYCRRGQGRGTAAFTVGKGWGMPSRSIGGLWWVGGSMEAFRAGLAGAQCLGVLQTAALRAQHAYPGPAACCTCFRLGKSTCSLETRRETH